MSNILNDLISLVISNHGIIFVFFSFLLSYAFIALGKITGIDMEIAAWFGWFVLIYLIVNEFRSILENLVECNYKVPKILIKGLKVFEEKIEGVIIDEDID